MTTVLKVHEPRELLALIPFQLGFVPTSSVVLVSLRGERQRIGLSVRMDVVELVEDASGGVAEMLLRCIERDHGQAVLVVVYSESELTVAQDTCVAAVRALSRAARATGGLLTINGGWLVTPDRFHVCEWDATYSTVLSWDLPGHPVEDLTGTEVGATMVMRGMVVADSRDLVGRIARVPPARRRAAAAGGRRWWARRQEGEVNREAWVEKSIDEWRVVLDACVADPGASAADLRERRPAAVAGRLAVSLRDAQVRDTVLAAAIARACPRSRHALGDGHDSRGSIVRSDPGLASTVDSAMRQVLDPDRGVAPEPDALARIIAALEAVGGHADRRSMVEVLAVLSVLAWWDGSGARARLLVTAALQRSPEHRLASLLEEVLDTGLAPGWVAHDVATGGRRE